MHISHTRPRKVRQSAGLPRLAAPVAAIGLVALPAVHALAAPPLPAPERSLMGIQLLASYRDVLHRFGQPSEIQAGQPAAPTQAAPAAGQSAMAGAARGGLPGFAGGMGGPPMGMMGGSGGGPPNMQAMMMQMYGAAGRGGGQMGGRPMGGPPMGMMGGPGGGGQNMQQMMMQAYGAAGRGGGPMGMGSMGGPMMRGMGAGAPAALNTPAGPVDTESAESTWWYHNNSKGIHFSFLFNRHGQVVQIQEYGWKGGGATRQGIGLGSSLGKLISKYGWSNDGEHNGDEMVMQYGGVDRLAFQLLNNEVVGITLGIVK